MADTPAYKLAPEAEKLEENLECVMNTMKRGNASAQDYRALLGVLCKEVRHLFGKRPFWPLLAQTPFTNRDRFVENGDYVSWCQTSKLAHKHRMIIEEVESGDTQYLDLGADLRKSDDGGVNFICQVISQQGTILLGQLLRWVRPSPQIVSCFIQSYSPSLRPFSRQVLKHSPIEIDAVSHVFSLYHSTPTRPLKQFAPEEELMELIVPHLVSLGSKAGRFLSVANVSALQFLESRGLNFSDPKLLEHYLKSNTVLDDPNSYFSGEVLAFLLARCVPSPKAIRLAKNKGIYYRHFATKEEVGELFNRCGVVKGDQSDEDRFLTNLIDLALYQDSYSVGVGFLKTLKAVDPILFELCGLFGELSPEIIAANDGHIAPTWRASPADNLKEFLKRQADYIREHATLQECQDILARTNGDPTFEDIRQIVAKKIGKLCLV